MWINENSRHLLSNYSYKVTDKLPSDNIFSKNYNTKNNYQNGNINEETSEREGKIMDKFQNIINDGKRENPFGKRKRSNLSSTLDRTRITSAHRNANNSGLQKNK